MPIHKGGASHARDPASSIAISLAARERAGRCARKLAAMARSSHPEPREPDRCNYISSQTLWANSTGSSGRIPSTSSAW